MRFRFLSGFVLLASLAGCAHGPHRPYPDPQSWWDHRLDTRATGDQFQPDTTVQDMNTCRDPAYAGRAVKQCQGNDAYRAQKEAKRRKAARDDAQDAQLQPAPQAAPASFGAVLHASGTLMP